MDIGFEIVGAKSKKGGGQDAPTQAPMTPRGSERRSPSTDQIKARRQIARSASGSGAYVIVSWSRGEIIDAGFKTPADAQSFMDTYAGDGGGDWPSDAQIMPTEQAMAEAQAGAAKTAGGFGSDFSGGGMMHALWIKIRDWIIGHNGYGDYADEYAFASLRPQDTNRETPIMDTSTQREAALLHEMSTASLDRQREIAGELDAISRARVAAFETDREIDFGGAVVRDTLTPVVTAAFHSVATDWMGEIPEVDPAEMQRAMTAAASQFFMRTAAEVKADPDEYRIQAEGMARLVAGAHAPFIEEATDAFVRHATFLNRTAAETTDSRGRTRGTNRPEGMGVDEFFGTIACEQCAGKGWIDLGIDFDFTPADNTCPTCGGSGLRSTVAASKTAGSAIVDGKYPIPCVVVRPGNRGGMAEYDFDAVAILSESYMEDVARGQSEQAAISAAMAYASERAISVVGPDGSYLMNPSALASVRTAAKCSNCTNGNHSGTNGTPGCKGGSCNCSCQKKGSSRTAAQVVYHESYGNVSRAQLAAYRKFNVSPSDHDSLADKYGADNHEAITRAVKQFSPNGMFSVFEMWDSERDDFGFFSSKQAGTPGAKPCDACQGSGVFGDDRCYVCGGSGDAKSKTAADADISTYPANEQAGYAESGLPAAVPVEGYPTEGAGPSGAMDNFAPEVAPENAAAVQQEGEHVPMPGFGEQVTSAVSARMRSVDTPLWGFQTVSQQQAIQAQAGVYCNTHQVWVGDGNAATHTDCKKEQKATDKTKDASLRVQARSISEIAREIESEWGNVNYAARPYLDAMHGLSAITDNYGADSAKTIVLYFLNNASAFRGEKAKAIKAELKAMVKSGSVTAAEGDWNDPSGNGSTCHVCRTEIPEGRAVRMCDDCIAARRGGESWDDLRSRHASSGGSTCATCGKPIQKGTQGEGWVHGPMPERMTYDHTATPKTAKVASDGSICGTCGDSIARDPEGEANRTWHHTNGTSHDHEAKPSGDSKESRLVTARATVKGIAIYPDKRVEEVTSSSYKDLQAIVGGLIEPVTLRDGSTMYVNEEYRYVYGPDDFNSIATDVCGLGGATHILLQGILGPVVIVGPLDAEGDDTDVTDTAKRWVQRVKREASLKTAADGTYTGPSAYGWDERCHCSQCEEDQIARQPGTHIPLSQIKQQGKTAGTEPGDQSGEAESNLPTPETQADTMWPWELPDGETQTGQDAAAVESVPTPGQNVADYPQPN